MGKPDINAMRPSTTHQQPQGTSSNVWCSITVLDQDAFLCNLHVHSRVFPGCLKLWLRYETDSVARDNVVRKSLLKCEEHQLSRMQQEDTCLASHIACKVNASHGTCRGSRYSVKSAVRRW